MFPMALAAMGPSSISGFSSVLGSDYGQGYMQGMGGPGGGGGSGGGFLGTASPAGAVLGGLQTLGNLWGAWQANKMAKKQFKFTKKMTNINLANQMKAYNTALADRARSRGVMEGQTQAEIDAYVNNNSLSKNGYKDGKTYSGNNFGNNGSIIPASYASSISGWSGSPTATPAASPSAAPASSGPGGLGGFGAVLAARAAQSGASSGSSSSGASASRAAAEDDTTK